MSYLSTMFKNANDIFEDVYPRLIAREGGPYKITTDTGGVTKGGIAQTSGRTAAQVRALTPDGIKNIWHKDWDQSGAKLNNPGAGELFFDMNGNMNPAQATRYLQRNVNHLLPEGQHIPEDGVFGSGTVEAANSVPPTALSRKLYASFRKHHADIARDRPTTHGQYLEGWNKRTADLAKSPLVAPVLVQPTLVKGVLHVPPAEVAQPPAEVEVRQQTQPGQMYAPPSVPVVTPGGPLQSLPGLSAPPSTQYVKQASISERLRQACAVTNASPTDKQKESGNCTKGEFDFKGQMPKAASVASLFRAAMAARTVDAVLSGGEIGRRGFLNRVWRNTSPHILHDRPIAQSLALAVSAANSHHAVDNLNDAANALASFNAPRVPTITKLHQAGDVSAAFTDAGELAASKLVMQDAATKLPRASTLAVLPGTYDRRSFLKRLGVATAIDSGVAPTVGKIGAGLVKATGSLGELVA